MIRTLIEPPFLAILFARVFNLVVVLTLHDMFALYHVLI